MLVATIVKEVPEYRIAAAEESPRQTEIGTFKTSKTKKVINVSDVPESNVKKIYLLIAKNKLNKK